MRVLMEVLGCRFAMVDLTEVLSMNNKLEGKLERRWSSAGV